MSVSVINNFFFSINVEYFFPIFAKSYVATLLLKDSSQEYRPFH